MSRILLLEDDISLIDGLTYALEKNGFQVYVARSIKEAGKLLEPPDCYDLLLFDVALPDGTGFALCEQLRQQGNRVPIIFLTAAEEEVNIIRGLDCGGDDYITKPFKLGELCSRIKALLRRSGAPLVGESVILRSGDITIDLLASRVTREGHILELTAAEYRLLCLLMRNSNLIVTRSMILDELWDGTGNYVDDNTLSVYIRRLREKIERDPSRPKHLITVRGFGYQWKEGAE